MSDFHDPDIAAMKLSKAEKDGLQVYRNYSRAFEQDREKRFSASLDTDAQVIADLETVLALIAREEPRSLPVIACAFADDQLKAMFRREVPDGVPGGRSELLSGFGPLARLSQRVQMAYAFGWISKDILIEVDHLRKVRNDISHKWDLKVLESKLSVLVAQTQSPIEEHLGDGVRLPEDFHTSLQPMQKLRVRLIWLLGRLMYESHLWVPALKANLTPGNVLYGPNQPAMLSQVAAVCLAITRSHVVREQSE
ncbi:hypothetical protein [Pseudomonas sp. St29]|uniref:hypothetical protein n=1 Tax=Pseudomonas sp. St29 TaxID=1500687 RepID=UPI0005FCC64E|nr:hypothetical protein [Pseudomonas sp. St29]BAQ79395.1 uncharacterized protein PST29_1506 [Pseudomonas sp. St29]